MCLRDRAFHALTKARKPQRSNIEGDRKTDAKHRSRAQREFGRWGKKQWLWRIGPMLPLILSWCLAGAGVLLGCACQSDFILHLRGWRLGLRLSSGRLRDLARLRMRAADWTDHELGIPAPAFTIGTTSRDCRSLSVRRSGNQRECYQLEFKKAPGQLTGPAWEAVG